MASDYFGIDLALRETGIARLTPLMTRPRPYTIRCPINMRGVERLGWWRETITKMLGHGPATVALEGYAHGRHNRAHQIGELGGIVRLALADSGATVHIVPPKIVKKLATGSGRARKEQVLAEAIRRLDYDGSSTDEADAMFLMEWLLHRYDHPLKTKLPKTHTNHIKKQA